MTLGEICNTLREVWGEYVAEGFSPLLPPPNATRVIFMTTYRSLSHLGEVPLRLAQDKLRRRGLSEVNWNNHATQTLQPKNHASSCRIAPGTNPCRTKTIAIFTGK
jgi:hypothetical protein